MKVKIHGNFDKTIFSLKFDQSCEYSLLRNLNDNKTAQNKVHLAIFEKKPKLHLFDSRLPVTWIFKFEYSKQTIFKFKRFAFLVAPELSKFGHLFRKKGTQK